MRPVGEQRMTKIAPATVRFTDQCVLNSSQPKMLMEFGGIECSNFPLGQKKFSPLMQSTAT